MVGRERREKIWQGKRRDWSDKREVKEDENGIGIAAAGSLSSELGEARGIKQIGRILEVGDKECHCLPQSFVKSPFFHRAKASSLFVFVCR